jgi:hypothetical protein
VTGCDVGDGWWFAISAVGLALMLGVLLFSPVRGFSADTPKRLRHAEIDAT